MTPINTLTSTAVPLPLPNIDTDQIIPKQFLKRIERTGYGDFLFFDWRYTLGTGSGLSEQLVPRHDFVLNKPEYAGSEILIAEKNFGCGSSREHAAWAINQYGFRAVIAPSFADIFFSNAGKNGIVLVRLSEGDVETLINRAQRLTQPWPAMLDHARIEDLPEGEDWIEKGNSQYKITINLQEQTVTDTEGFHATFDIDPFRKECLLNGWDDIGLTLRHEEELSRFESKHDTEFWLSPKASVTA